MAIIKYSMEVPQKNKNRTLISFSNTITKHIYKEMKLIYALPCHYTPIHSSQDMVDSIWVSINECLNKRSVSYLSNDILFKLNTEGNLTICKNIVSTGGHCAKWNKPRRGKSILHDFAYICLYLRLQMEMILVVSNHKKLFYIIWMG